MEHRCTERTASELNVLIYKHNNPIATGRIKNCSHAGVFVETDFMDIDCEHQLTFEVLFNENSAIKFQRVEMKAIVIHKASKGFGAEVDFLDSSQANVFKEILRGPQLIQPNSNFAMAANS